MKREISHLTRPATEARDIDEICDVCGEAFETVENVDGTYHDHFGRTTGEIPPGGGKQCATCAHMDED